LAATGPRALPAELVDEIKQQIPFGVSHPLLRTHPETGKTGLYLHGGFLRHDSLYDGRTNSPLGEAESKGILRELLQQHSRPEYSCRFKWLPGSIAFWDNRAVQHYAASDYYPHERHLRRVTVSGDVPFYDPSRQVSAS
jgi:taurine dioxygenase